MVRHVSHHSMVRTQLVAELKDFTLDTIIAVGDYDPPHDGHTHVELFTLSSSKWETKKHYPYSMDIARCSILAVEKKFMTFGGWSDKRKALTKFVNKGIKIHGNIIFLNFLNQLIVFRQYQTIVKNFYH